MLLIITIVQRQSFVENMVYLIEMVYNINYCTFSKNEHLDLCLLEGDKNKYP